MEEFNDLLQKPLIFFNPLKPESTFKSIADDLMKDYCIKCGGNEFYFAELEFYYYRTKDKEILESANSQWEGVTYPRITKAGDFFYHLSGCDICFESHLVKSGKEIDGEGGGILIRSLVDKSGNVTAGPINCVNTMLNACGRGIVPFLDKKEEKRVQYVEACSTFRFLGDKDYKNIIKGENNDGKYKLAFYDKKISPNDWNKARPSYYSYRFKYDNN
jgi:hypothetical protein